MRVCPVVSLPIMPLLLRVVNQNDSGVRQWQTRRDTVNQNELRHSSKYNVVISHWELTFFWWFLFFLVTKRLQVKLQYHNYKSCFRSELPVSCFKGISVCIAVYGKNAFWINEISLLQYLEWPMGKIVRHHKASPVSTSYKKSTGSAHSGWLLYDSNNSHSHLILSSEWIKNSSQYKELSFSSPLNIAKATIPILWRWSQH